MQLGVAGHAFQVAWLAADPGWVVVQIDPETGCLEHRFESADEPVHFVQMWVLPDTDGVTPGYEQMDINGELAKGGLQPIASGQGHDSAIRIHQRDAVLWGGRLKAGETVSVPDGPNAHLFVALGATELEGAGALTAGDAVRLAGAGSPRLTAGPDGAEVLIWVTG